MARGDGEDTGRSRLSAVLYELRGLTEPIGLLRRIAAELVLANERLESIATTSKFNRGNYDGPFLAGHTYILGPEETRVPRAIFAGRGKPAVLLIEIAGTGIVGDELFIGDDMGALTTGFRVSLASASTLRIIADAHQEYFAQPNFTALVSSVVVRVREGRL